MCKYYVINELALGNRSLGYELATDKEIVEMTAKGIRDGLKAGKEIYGLKVADNGIDLVLDDKFYMKNYMVKTHINSLKPKYEEDCMANIMYVVTGSKLENGKQVYNVISSRFERTSFSEEKLKAMLELGVIAGGCKLNGDKIILPEPKVAQVEPAPAQVKTEDASPVQKTNKK